MKGVLFQDGRSGLIWWFADCHALSAEITAHDAATSGHGETVAALLELGASPVAQDREGRTPLSWAEDRDHAEVAEMLRKAAAGGPPPAAE